MWLEHNHSLWRRLRRLSLGTRNTSKLHQTLICAHPQPPPCWTSLTAPSALLPPRPSAPNRTSPAATRAVVPFPGHTSGRAHQQTSASVDSK
eukprot:12340756-Alexandrium_andersonii.AAC.1